MSDPVADAIRDTLGRMTPEQVKAYVAALTNHGKVWIRHNADGSVTIIDPNDIYAAPPADPKEEV